MNVAPESTLSEFETASNRSLHRPILKRSCWERGEAHDSSKFGPEERIPYIWLTEFHRCRRIGKPFQYPEGVEPLIRLAIEHHMSSNRHHPEHHANPNDMTKIDLIEMVCDWTAMAQEFEQDGGSARSWANKTIGHHVHFNEANREFVYKIIEQLDNSDQA